MVTPWHVNRGGGGGRGGWRGGRGGGGGRRDDRWGNTTRYVLLNWKCLICNLYFPGRGGVTEITMEEEVMIGIGEEGMMIGRGEEGGIGRGEEGGRGPHTGRGTGTTATMERDTINSVVQFGINLVLCKYPVSSSGRPKVLLSGTDFIEGSESSYFSQDKYFR